MVAETRRLALMPYLIFSSRWLQLPLYLGLIVAQALYAVQFVRELWHLLDTTLSMVGSMRPLSDKARRRRSCSRCSVSSTW